ncbi:MAG: hypothetical protein GXP29_14250 [Planctomycetes bacterium]|nr:hypothetical protein [Planctomycetota bacterium]
MQTSNHKMNIARLATLGIFFLLAVPTRAAGPDILVSDLPFIVVYNTTGGISAYGIATTSCNIGDAPASWFDDPIAPDGNLHPVIAQNLYRYENDRFEQIGMSWVKHGFCGINDPGCNGLTCQATDCDSLGVGCSDTYAAITNANQVRLGPRSEVNASTGEFPYPFTSPSFAGGLARRLQVSTDALDPSLHPTARYFGEGQYVSQDDAQSGNGLNTIAYREAIVTGPNGGGWSTTFVDVTTAGVPAILAWAALDPGVQMTAIDIPNDGRLNLAWRVQDCGTNCWSYEYLLHNQTSDRSVGTFAVPFASGVSVTSIGFHDIDYHSDEVLDSTDWVSSQSACNLEWATTPFATDPLANALRWGTAYNFRFIANSPPVVADISIGLFKPGTPTTMTVSALAPSSACSSGDVNCDAVVDLIDFAQFQSCFGTSISGVQDPCATFDTDCSSTVDLIDFAAFLPNLDGP